MREYETTFIVQPEISDQGCQELFARVDAVLEQTGATKLLHEDQGKRRLAYEIRKFQKGRYVTAHYLSEGAAVAPLERALRLEESVLRYLTVQKSAAVADVQARITWGKEEAHARAERERDEHERDQRGEQEERAWNEKPPRRPSAAAPSDAAAPAPADDIPPPEDDDLPGIPEEEMADATPPPDMQEEK